MVVHAQTSYAEQGTAKMNMLKAQHGCVSLAEFAGVCSLNLCTVTPAALTAVHVLAGRDGCLAGAF